MQSCCGSDDDCDNGVFCDGQEQCVAFSCIQGEEPICDDSLACTADSCDIDGTDACLYTPDDTLCDDTISCTTDTCDTTTGCLYIPHDSLCDDGQPCTTSDVCNPSSGCTYTLDHTQCDDSLDCSDDTCVPSTGCTHSPDHTQCDDTLECTNDVCDLDLAACTHTPDDTACTDAVTCTIDSCDPTAGCVFTPDDTLCDDGQWCNGFETCDAALDCLPGSIVSCDDAVDCTDDACDEDIDSCVSIPNDLLCPADPPCGDSLCDPTDDCMIEWYEDGHPCNDIPENVCVAHVCVVRECGDGWLEALDSPHPTEECDDGNTDPDDACSSTCTSIDFQVNTSDLWAEQNPSVSVFADGSFIVAFEQESYESPDWTDVRFRRYDHQGLPIDLEDLLLTTDTNGIEMEPQIVALTTGGFAAAWAKNPSDGDLFGIQLGIYDFTGAELDIVQVNTDTFASQTSPFLTIDPTGTELLVLWEDDAPSPGSLGTIAFRRFDTSGVPIDADQVNVPTGSFFVANQPTAAYAADGSFLIAWTHSLTGAQTDVMVKLYNSSAVPLSTQTSVTSLITDGHEYFPSVAYTPISYGPVTPGFVVVWEEITGTGSTQIAAILVDSAGDVVPSSEMPIAFPVSAPPYEEEYFSPQILTANLLASHYPTPESGDPVNQDLILIAYVGTSPAGDTDLPYDIIAHRWVIDASGYLTAFDDDALVITTTTQFEQSNQAFAVGPTGALTLTWTDFSREGTDADHSAFRARLLPLGWMVLP